MKQILTTIFISVLVLSCNKEGQGGTSIIEGQLMAQNHTTAKPEIFEITFTNGSSVEHGDYWLINSPSTNSYYYVWYNNPTWVTNGNPNLTNRIGIEVGFNYSDSNIDIATNTKNAILNKTNLFTIQQLSDILKVTCVQTGDTPDATDFTTPFDINIEQQGQNNNLDNAKPLVGERVYIIYGNNSSFNDNVTSGPNGKFKFKYLTKGDYTLQVYTKDTISGNYLIKEIPTSVTKNKSVVNVGDIIMYN